MAILPDITLKTVDFKPAVFTPIEYKMEVNDVNLPQRSLALQNSYKEQYRSDRAMLSAEGNKMYAALNPEERDWFNKQRQDYLDRAAYEASVGNMGTAIRIAQEGGQWLGESSELQNKVLANQGFQKRMEQIKSNNNLDPETKRYYEAHNKYYDDGTGEWKEQVGIVDDIDTDTLVRIAAAETSEYSNTTNRTRNNLIPEVYDARGRKIEEEDSNAVPVKITKTVDTDKTYNITRHRKTPEELYDTFKKVLNDDPAIDTRLRQKFKVYDWALRDYYSRMNDISLSESERNNAESKYKELSRTMLNKDGMPFASYEEWLDTRIKPIFDNIAYDNVSTTDSKSTGIHYNENNLQINRQNALDSLRDIDEDVTVSGTQTKTKYKPNEPSDNTNVSKDAKDYGKHIKK